MEDCVADPWLWLFVGYRYTLPDIVGYLEDVLLDAARDRDEDTTPRTSSIGRPHMEHHTLTWRTTQSHRAPHAPIMSVAHTTQLSSNSTREQLRVLGFVLHAGPALQVGSAGRYS